MEIEVLSGVTSLMELELEESDRFCLLQIPFMTPSLMIQWKLDCQSWKQKQKNQPITRFRIEHCDWFIPLLLLLSLTMKFSLDHKRRGHEWNQYSASYSIGLNFDHITLRLRLHVWLCRQWKAASSASLAEISKQTSRTGLPSQLLLFWVVVFCNIAGPWYWAK